MSLLSQREASHGKLFVVLNPKAVIVLVYVSSARLANTAHGAPPVCGNRDVNTKVERRWNMLLLLHRVRRKKENLISGS
jgi:hypothetical protein